MATVADLIVRRLRDYGVRDIFGYPGGQLTPLYDAIYREPAVRHRLARHEQAAAFMADGFARSTGRPGVCLAVCGPGVFNAATPLSSAFTDSIPLLLISGQVPTKARGLRSGYYHENEQIEACETLTKWRVRIEEPNEVVALLDRAWAETTRVRPGPVLVEVPLDVLRAEVSTGAWPVYFSPALALEPSSDDLSRLSRLISGWKRPLLLAGGGVVAAGAETLLARLAERLAAPVFHSPNGKCALASSHPLAAGLPWNRATSDASDMSSFLSPLFAEADGLLAIGCRFSQLSTASWALRPPPSLAQIDVDPTELGRHYPCQVAVRADASVALEKLLRELPSAKRQPWTAVPKRERWYLPGADILVPLRRVLPLDGIVVADVTRLAYIMMAEFPLDHPRTFLHPAGAVAMGYGIPAALGAKTAFPKRKVVAVVGDGCFMMSGMELASAKQENLSIVIVLINDNCLTLIKSTQQRRYAERYIAVDLQNPDFGQFAAAFGVRYWRCEGEGDFERCFQAALDSDEVALVELRLKSA
jgi:thiamine pyrophosphate-dependent acetolactate synthase large subunit-like protein